LKGRAVLTMVRGKVVWEIIEGDKKVKELDKLR